MRLSAFFPILSVLLFGVVWSRGRTTQAGEKKDTRPFMATIVVVGVIDADGVRGLTAIRVTDRQKLSALESFFPSYQQRPSASAPAGWEAGYHVYFDFPGGETINVTVSRDTKGGAWSVGNGDHPTRGDFQAFVAQLETLK